MSDFYLRSESVAYRISRVEGEVEVEALRPEEVLLGPQQGYSRLR
jgi:hypothetical protein